MPDSAPHKETVIAVVGNPNTGKSALFNNLTGLRQKTANYPGVTVERHTGVLKLSSGPVTLVDLPGTYSLAPYSPDEMVSADVLLGRIDDMPAPDAVLMVIDATNLRRNLFMATQVLELGIPAVIALNMTDIARKRGISIDHEMLSEKLDATVIPVIANIGMGMTDIKNGLELALSQKNVSRPSIVPEIRAAAEKLQQNLQNNGDTISIFEAERALIDKGGAAETRMINSFGESATTELNTARNNLQSGRSVATIEAQSRYNWIDSTVAATEKRQPARPGLTDLMDKLTSHSFFGLVLFFAIMATVFQAVFSWAGPLMDLIDETTVATGALIANTMPEGALQSLLIDGVIAGVGSVIIFLPQILILFAFIIFLEDSGYMARAAFLMDRVMRACGLSGQSFIPMLSSFACAVPGVMATRVIPNPRDRLATMLAAPFMTCSARLPVYALLIAAFIPDETVLGFLNTQGLVLFGLYLLGIAGGIFTAWMMKRLALKGPTPIFLIELPPYRLPNFKSMAIRLLDRGKIFVYRAGTVIFTVAIVIWALVYFPRPDTLFAEYDEQRMQIIASSTLNEEERAAALSTVDNQEGAALLEQSFLGRMGKTIQPVFAPLGWDWKVTAGVIASFPAREVVVAVLGTIYSVGAEVDETDERLLERLQNAKNPDGTPVFTTGMAVGLMIFFAFCLQCMATVAIMRRETNGWKWPLSAWLYMTSLGYVGALLANQLI
ncbi:MAG: ferrous iron transport protein B [Gammaproteobacteria bacterium]